MAGVPHVTFAKAIQRHAACPAADVEAGTLRGVLDGYFALHPEARTYVLDVTPPALKASQTNGSVRFLVVSAGRGVSRSRRLVIAAPARR